MANCEGCAAPLPADALACPFCGAPTALAAQKKREAEEAAAAEARRKRAEIDQQLRASGNAALLWSAVGLFFCVLAVPSLVGVVLALRTRALAKAHGLIAPSTVTVSLVLGVLSLALLGTGVVVGVRQSKKADERRAVLQAQVAQTEKLPALDDATACALAELYLLEIGWEGKRGPNVAAFRCAGKVRLLSEDAAAMGEVEFRVSPDKPVQATACFKRGARWRVKALSLDDRCDAAAPAPQ
jgi:hypothetical protein